MATKTKAGPAEIGRVAIMAPRNGPTRSTSAETATTIAAVASILARRPAQNGSDSPGSIPQITPWQPSRIRVALAFKTLTRP